MTLVEVYIVYTNYSWLYLLIYEEHEIGLTTQIVSNPDKL